LWLQLWEDMKIWLMKLCAKWMLCTDEWVRAFGGDESPSNRHCLQNRKPLLVHSNQALPTMKVARKHAIRIKAVRMRVWFGLYSSFYREVSKGRQPWHPTCGALQQAMTEQYLNRNSSNTGRF
jgi:hypothetical protein